MEDSRHASSSATSLAWIVGGSRSWLGCSAATSIAGSRCPAGYSQVPILLPALTLGDATHPLTNTFLEVERKLPMNQFWHRKFSTLNDLRLILDSDVPLAPLAYF